MLPGNKLEPVRVTLERSTTPGTDYLFTVDTPSLKIHPGDELEFQFVDCKTPTIMIPVSGVMETRIAVENEKDPGIVRMRVLDNPDMSHTTFAYAIYSPEIDDFAEGNSPPRMVLESRPFS